MEARSGAEARLILVIFSARLKPCPYYKASWIEFFRSLPLLFGSICGTRPGPEGTLCPESCKALYEMS